MNVLARIGTVAVVAVASSSAAQEDAPRAPAAAAHPAASAPAGADERIEALLLRWEEQSRSTTSLTVKFRRTDNIKAFGEEPIVYEGQARLQSPDLVFIDFNRVEKDKKTPVFEERIVCDGKKVFQFTAATRQVSVWGLPQDQQHKALQEGPLPFLFNMSAAKAKERYDMRFKLERPATAQTPAGYVVEIYPKLPIDQEEYSKALIFLDKEKMQPLMLQLVSPNQKDTKTFDFRGRDYLINAAIPPSWFNGDKMTQDLLAAKPPWDLVDNTKAATPGARQPAASQGQVGQAPRPPGRSELTSPRR
jgi:TIGR03009 family protein